MPCLPGGCVPAEIGETSCEPSYRSHSGSAACRGFPGWPVDNEEVQGPSVWASKGHRPVCLPSSPLGPSTRLEDSRDPRRKRDKPGVLSGPLRGAGWLGPTRG